jgi:hypothetical protein
MEKERIEELAQAIANINKQTNENLISPDEAEDQILDLLFRDSLFGLHHMDEIDSIVQQILKEN